MKRIKSLLYRVLLTVAVLAAQSCVNDFDDDCNRPLLSGEVKVRFSMTFDRTGDATSRAGVWNPNEPCPGSEFDRTVNLDSKFINIILIDPITGEIIHVNLDSGYQFNPVTGGYDMEGTFNLDGRRWTAGKYRVMILANYWNKNSTPEIKACANLRQLQPALDELYVDWYDKVGKWNSKNVPNIPMWGVGETNLHLDGKHDENLGSIAMLRAIAKVKIALDPKIKEQGYTLASVTVNKYNQKANCLPAGWLTATQTRDPLVANDAPFNPRSSSASGLTITAPGDFEESTEDGSIVFYLPEYKVSDSDTEHVKLSVTVNDKNGVPITFPDAMEIDNSVTGGAYTQSVYNVVRNHFYLFNIDGVNLGEFSYRAQCWNYVPSEIGWNPVSFTFTATDPEATDCYVTSPNYPKNKNTIESGTAYADYKFTLTSPKGAVWRAFLVQKDKKGNEVYYSGDKLISDDEIYPGLTLDNAANTPTGFFFGTGNDDGNNKKAVTTGIARDEEYIIKVGTRLNSVNFSGSKPEMMVTGQDENGNDIFDTSIMKNNDNARYWKEKGEVPTCYLVIKIALDGKKFSDELKINRPLSELTSSEKKKAQENYREYQFAGTPTRVEIRQLFPIKKKEDSASKLIIGINSSDEVYKTHTWWSYPMGHKNAPAGTETNTETNP
ncbi:MAG: hypothetical protein NC248_01055 [Bacteroides sp.]|nr:hypothetical protein [Bacteroides sp.]MCM1389357.1 hypothetical protein [Bacteroides sp.]